MNDLTGPTGCALTFPALITGAEGTQIRIRPCRVNYRTAAPPQDADSIVESIITESISSTHTVL